LKKNAKYAAPALDKGLDILEYLAESGVPASQSEIANALGRSPTEIFRMLARLEDRGYIYRHPVSAKYQLSLKLFQLSRTHSPIEALRRTALRPMQELAEQTGHPAHMSVLDRDAIVVVTQVRGPNPVVLSIQEGARFPVETTTSGRLLLACMPEASRDDILAKSKIFQSWSPRRRTAYLKELEKIRENGHHIARSAITDGVIDIAALIGQRDGALLASLAISCVSSTLGRKSSPESLLEAAVSTANQINRINGFNT